MRSFRKNVLRLAWKNKASVLGSILIIAIGIFVLVAMFDTLQNLTDQIFRYYEQYEMADVFVTVRGIPLETVQRMGSIEGIAKADGKLSVDVRMICEGQTEIATVHLMGYREDAWVNQMDLFGKSMTDETVFLGSRMAQAYGFSEGDSLSLLIGGESYDFTFAGSVGAPDYVYAVSTESAMVPDGELYDTACISQERLARLLGQSGQVNELGFLLAPGYSFDDVKYALETALAEYGVLSITEKKDQTSYNMVDGEITELVSIGTILPLLFMAISVFMLYISLKKMIDHDQTLIGSMKAFGMTNGELVGSYLIEGLVIGTVGAALGWVLAIPFGMYMYGLYLDFFTLPVATFHNYWNTRLIGLAIALLTAVGAVLLGVRRVLNITPAMAMKSRAPAVSRQSVLPQSWTARLGTFRKLGVRSMTRSPLRGLLIILAVAFPFALSPVLFSFSPIVEDMIDAYFGTVRTYDLQLSMAGFSDPAELGNAGKELPYVTDAEGILQTPVQLKNDNRKEYSMLYGLQKGSELWKVGDNEGRTFDPPDTGIVLNERLAKKLHLREGDVVSLNLTAYGNTWVDVPVRRVVTEIFGGSCYMDLASFPRQLGVSASANTLLLSVQEGHTADVKEAVRNTSMVPSIIDTEKISSSFAGMMDSMVVMVNMFALFAVIAGFVLIHNISMINIRERFTELGTLEVLGATKPEIDGMLRDESFLYFLGGVLLGIPGSFGFKKLIEVLIISESYAIRIHIQPFAYAATFLMCAGMMWLAWKQDTKLIRTITLTDILKERE